MLAHLISAGLKTGAAAIAAAGASPVPLASPAKAIVESHGVFSILNVDRPAKSGPAVVQLGRSTHIDRDLLEKSEVAPCR